MNCVLTKQPTTRLTKSIPLSRQGKEYLAKITDIYNEKLFQSFKDGLIEAEKKTGKPVPEDKLLNLIAPKVSSSNILRSLNSGVVGKDLKEVISEVVSE